LERKKNHFYKISISHTEGSFVNIKDQFSTFKWELVFLFLEKGENRKVNVKIQKNDNKSWTIEYNGDVVFLKQTLGRESALKFHQN